MSTILVLVVVTALVAAVLFRLHRRKREGRSCCGCAFNSVCNKRK